MTTVYCIEEKILPAIEADDWNAAYEEFDYIAKDWDRFRSVSAFFIDTGAVNETDRVISKVYYYIKFRESVKFRRGTGIPQIQPQLPP